MLWEGQVGDECRMKKLKTKLFFVVFFLKFDFDGKAKDDAKNQQKIIKNSLQKEYFMKTGNDLTLGK